MQRINIPGPRGGHIRPCQDLRLPKRINKALTRPRMSASRPRILDMKPHAHEFGTCMCDAPMWPPWRPNNQGPVSDGFIFQWLVIQNRKDEECEKSLAEHD